MRCSICGQDGFDSLPVIRAHQLKEHPGEKGKSKTAERARRRRSSTEGKAPPPTAKTPDVAPTRTRVAAKIEKRMQEQLGWVGLALLPMDPAAGRHVIACAPQVANAWARAAEDHKWIRDMLEKSMKGGSLFSAIASTGVLIYPLAVHYGWAPEVALPFIPRVGAVRDAFDPEAAAADTRPDDLNREGAPHGSAGLVG